MGKYYLGTGTNQYNFQVVDSTGVIQDLNLSGLYLSITGKAADADKLDNYDSSFFRNAANLTGIYTGQISGGIGNADTLDGLDSSYFLNGANITGTVALSGTFTGYYTGAFSGTITHTDSITFHTGLGINPDPAELTWSDDVGTMQLGLQGGNIDLRVGLQNYEYVTNRNASTLSKGSVVYISGAQGNRPAVALALANADSTSAVTFGILAENIASMANGYAITNGLLTNLNTTGFAEGAALYLSPTVSGAVISSKPQAPNHSVLVGFCVRSHASAGEILVKIQNGVELDELHDVRITSAQNNDIIRYNAPSGVWFNSNTLALNGTGSHYISGDLGIGTSSPSAKLHIFGADKRQIISSTTDNAALVLGQWDGTTNRIESSTRKLLLTSYANGISLGVNGSENVHVSTSGNLGVGTTSPQFKLDVNGIASIAQSYYLNKGFADGVEEYLIRGSAGSWNGFISYTPSSSTANRGFKFGAWDNGGNRNDWVSIWNGNVGIGTTSPLTKLNLSGGGGAVYQTFTDTTNAYHHGYVGKNGGGLVFGFSSQNGSFSADEKMRITTSGNVGIGLISPDSKLHIAGTHADEGADRAAATVLTLDTRTDGTGTGKTYFKTGWINTGNYGVSTIGVGYWTGSNAIRDVLTLLGNGNVGIGVTAPDAKLQVDGHVHIGNATAWDNPASWNRTILVDGTNHARIRLRATAYAPGNNNLNEVYLWVDNSVAAPYGGLYADYGLQIGSGNSSHIALLPAGNVGIGTTTPDQKLDVRGYVVSNANNLASEGGFYLGNNGHGIRRAATTNDVYVYTTSGSLYLGASGTNTQHVTINSSGNVIATGNITSSTSTNATQTIQVTNSNAANSALSRLAVSNGTYEGSITVYGTGFTTNNAAHQNRMTIAAPFICHNVSGQHYWWIGTTGAGHDPTNANQVMILTTGGQFITMPPSYSYSAWGLDGINTSFRGRTVTDGSTAVSGTVASAAMHSFGTSALAATNTSVTTTNAATVYIAGGPIAGTNQTITNSWGLWNAGKTRLDSDLFFNTDVKIYRSGANKLATNATGIDLDSNITIQGGGNITINAGSSGQLFLGTNGTTNAITINTSQNATFAGFVGWANGIAYPGGLGANGQARIYSSSTYGLVLYGQGSTSDILLTNRGGSSVITVPANTINVEFAGNVLVAGNLTINGTTTTVNSTTITVDDPIFTLGGDTSVAETTKDRGIEFKWNGTTLTITNYIGNGTTTVTGTVASTSGYAAGDIITISGATGTEQSKLNGTWKIASVPNASTFTFVVSSSVASATYTTNLGTTVKSKNGFFGLDQSTGRFIFIPQSNNSSEVFAGTVGGLDLGDTWFNLGNYSGTRALNFYVAGTNRQAFISSTGGGNFTGDIRFGVNGVTSDTDAIEVARINSIGLHIGPAGNASAPLQIENATTTSSRQVATGLRLSSPAGNGQTTPSIEFTTAVGTGAAIDTIRTAASYASSLRFFTSIAASDTPTLALTLDSAQSATVTNNFTVSGGTITGGATGLSLAAGGTNQNITLTPSGTGLNVLGTSIAGVSYTNATVVNSSGFVPSVFGGPRISFILLDQTTAFGSSPYSAMGFYGARGPGTYDSPFASILGGKENTTQGNNQGYFDIYTTASNTVPTFALRVDSAQRVGIGTSSPGRKLDVNGDANIGTNLVVGTAVYSAQYIAGNSTATYWKSSTSSTLLTLLENGNFGVGVTSPNYKLDVGGAISMHDEAQDIDSRFYGGSFLRGWSSFVSGSESNITYTTDSTCPGGNEILSVNSYVWARGPKIRLDRTQNYEVEMWVKRQTANTPGHFYFVVSNYDSSGNVIAGDGTDWHYPVALNPPPSTWTKYRFVVGPYGGLKDHASNASHISIGFIANLTSGNDVVYFTGFKCRPIPRYNNDALTIYNNGSVGVGTSSPNAKLQIAGTGTGILTVGTLTNDWGGVVAIGTTDGNGIILSKINAANDSNRVLTLMRDDTNGASITGYKSGGTSADIGFQIRANAKSYFNGGNVGIANNDPYSSLSVKAQAASWGEGILVDPASTGYSGVYFRTEANQNSSYTGTWAIGKNASGQTGGEILHVVKNGLTGGALHRVDAAQSWKTTGETCFGFNVGIGFTTPDQPLAFADSVAMKIQLNGSNANGYQLGLATAVNSGDAMMKFIAGETGAGEFGFYTTTNLRLLINKDGNVGIGTTTPNYKLQVQGNAYINSTLFVNGETTLEDKLIVKTQSGSHNVAVIDYSGVAGGRIQVLVDGVVRSQIGSYSADNTFFNAGYGGNVGIGISTPSDKLDILGTTASNAGRIMFGDGGSYTPYMRFYKWTGSSTNYYQTTIANSITAAGALEFYTGGGGAAIGSDTQSLRMIILQGGNVGIGTTSPSARLHVSGGRTYLASSDGYELAFARSGAYFYFYNDNGGSTGKLSLTDTVGAGNEIITFTQDTRRVGIGTTSPGYKLEVNGSFAATTKSFVIPHPTKEGKKLRYGSLEGPENGVYVRGKTTSKVIELPDYWTKLVDPESISVQLTPIGSHQKLYVEKIEDNKVYIANENLLAKSINCFFYILAERADVEKLQVEIDA